MRKKILWIGLLFIILIISYHLLIRPFNWAINEKEVKGLTLNGIKVSEEQKNKLIKAYNGMKSVKRRSSTEGSTPKYVCTIELSSGETIDIQDVGTNSFIVEKRKETGYKSYWANSSSLYNTAESMGLKYKK